MALRLNVISCKENLTVQRIWERNMPDQFDATMDDETFKTLSSVEGVRIDGFVGGVEVDASVLDQDVPSTFPGNVLIEDETETPIKFKDYCNFILSQDKAKAVLIVGKTDDNGNRRDVVGHDELMAWIKHFRIENMMTKSVMKSLLTSTAYTPVEDTIIKPVEPILKK